MRYDINSEIYILGGILNTFDGDQAVEAMEDFVTGKNEFQRLKEFPPEYLLDNLKENLINGQFLTVTLTNEGIRQRCLEWVEKQSKKQGRKSQQIERKIATFEGIFHTKEDADTVLKILGENNYLEDGKWNRECGRPKNDLMVPFYVLKSYFSVFSGNNISETARIRAWCQGLGETVTDNEIRSLRINPINGKNPTNTVVKRFMEFYVLFKYHFIPRETFQE